MVKAIGLKWLSSELNSLTDLDSNPTLNIIFDYKAQSIVTRPTYPSFIPRSRVVH